jgi:alpha-mannosidase
VLPFCQGGAAGARPGSRGRDAGPSPTPKPGITLGDRAVQVAAFKKAEDGNDLIIRLFEPTGRPRRTTVRLPVFGASARVRLGPFEVKTLRFNPRRRTFVETDLLERRLKDA